MDQQTRRFGLYEVSILHDGFYEAPIDVLTHAAGPAARDGAIAAWGRPTLRIVVNCFLLRGPGGITLVDEIVHETADGKRLLVIHGDLFDLVVRNAKWLALLGDWAYTLALASNVVVNKVRRLLHLPHWSLSAWAKNKVKNAVSYIGEFETCLAAEARRHQADGVVCGHIHHAAFREIDGLTYINTGDWVESCTAVIEHHDGRFEMIRWPQGRLKGQAAVPVVVPARPAPVPALVEAA